METIIKIVIILVIIIIYFMTMKNCFEYFAVLPYNSKISNSNKSNNLKDRHSINSVNTDIITSENTYYYEFSNEKYLELLIDMFNPSPPEKYIILRNIMFILHVKLQKMSLSNVIIFHNGINRINYV